MAQPWQNITISSPGFYGLNSQDSPIEQDPGFAAKADNCVIDRFGRLGARKGFDLITESSAPLGSSRIAKIHEFIAQDGTSTILSTGNNKIFSGVTTLTDETPGGAIINGDNWDIATLNDECYFFQRDNDPIVYRASTGAATLVSAHPSYLGTVQQANVCIAAYGRLWTADTSADKHTVWWSDLLQGFAWTGGTSGSIDVEEFWPNGSDEIVDLAAHNGYLIIFGKRSILIYSGADGDPGTDLVLDDAILNFGAVDRGTVFTVGGDLWFLDFTGVRSLGRTIQEKSVPIGDVSYFVRDELIADVQSENTKITCFYHPEEAFYLVGLLNEGIVYCIDARRILDGGRSRVTKWNQDDWSAFARKISDGTMYIGSSDGIGMYSGYTDNGSSYRVEYLTQELTFGEPARIKLPKQLDLTIIGGEGDIATVRWGFDYLGPQYTKDVTLIDRGGDEYNVAEYGEAEYSLGVYVDRSRVNISGSGTSMVIGLSLMPTSQFSIQEMNLQALIGRIK